MKNAYLRNMMISVAVHVACVYALIAFSLASCHFRRPPKDLTFFVDFQPGPPSAPIAEPENAIAEPAKPDPVNVPEPIPEPPAPKTNLTENAKKPKIEISTNLVRRTVPAAKRPVKQLSEARIRRMLGTAVASVGAPAAGYGTGSGSGEATPYGWYLAQVRAVMYDAWAQPSALAGKRGLVTSVLIRVRQDGQIVQKKMVDTSGNGLMDTSVMTAVESVKNLPALPFGFGGAYKDITIDFELEDTGP
ncbi:MAG: TonB C-terminal domain-containing protein [Verrucomicrobia bacterium]|nr:TonB C-terminal domain-containing protein [Verrucomicrobiota bacterium]MBU1736250.1 TonB C-terminal domain-containing protein [Verrucomicrobiota bacterium]MBU1856968.1 TonB C-terminal domain-containing protein [Verrucomicrobiota bacterium]